MLSGMIDTEGFHQVMRDIAQKRRHGVLEIKDADSHTEIYFVAGRIVEARRNGLDPWAELGASLRSAEEIEGSPPNSYGELFEQLPSQPAFDAAKVKLYVKHRVLQHLYNLTLNSGAVYSFQSQMVEYEKEWAPMITVGQLLLDLVALQSERSRLDALLPSGALIARTAQTPSTSFSDEERIVYDLLARPMTRDAVQHQSHISSYAIHDALMGMVERGLVGVMSAEDELRDEGESAVLPEARASEVHRTAVEGAVAEDIGEASTVLPPPVPIQMISLRLVHATWVPPLVAWLILGAVIFVPWLMWVDALRQF